MQMPATKTVGRAPKVAMFPSQGGTLLVGMLLGACIAFFATSSGFLQPLQTPSDPSISFTARRVLQQEDNGSAAPAPGPSAGAAAAGTCAVGACPAAASNLAPPPGRESLWKPLSIDELARVEEFLLSVPDLDLIPATDDAAAIRRNQIFLIELLPPPKAAALAYLNGTRDAPPRTAKATLIQGESASIVLVSVPLLDPSSYEVLGNYSGSAWLRRPEIGPEYAITDELINTVLEFTLANLIAESFGGWTYADDCDRCLTYSGTDPLNYGTPTRGYWSLIKKDFVGRHSYPIPLQLFINTTSTNTSEWAVTKVWYAGAYFDSAEALAAAYANPDSGIRRVNDTVDPFEEPFLRGSFDVRGPARPGSEVPGPRTVLPAGRRFVIDDNKVAWMGWSFDVTVTPMSGLALFDLRFKNESIAYEIALKEASAHYGGPGDPKQITTQYLDSFWGLGIGFRSLADGTDCPIGAQYLSFPTHYGGSWMLIDVVCVFEHNNDVPLRTHLDTDYWRYDGLEDHVLIVRGISTVDNYDYMIDIVFHTNGVVAHHFHASGYAQAAPLLDPEVDIDYGYPMNQFAGGTIHLHNLAWKLDLDIAGQRNSFQKNYVRARMGYQEANGAVMDVPYVAREIAETEADGTVVMSIQEPMLMTFMAENQTNQWGSTRGYRLINLSPTHHVLSNNNVLWNNAQWLKYHVAVTKQKDSEQDVSTPFNGGSTQFDPSAIAFDDYLADNESIRNEDLVAWVNVGHWHMPVAEDNPVTTTPGNQHGWVLKPFNFATEDMSTDMANTRQMESDENGVAYEANDLFPGFGDLCALQLQPQDYRAWLPDPETTESDADASG